MVPQNKEIQKTIQYIKDLVEQEYGYSDIKVLYGGSVTDKNVEMICQIKNIDGVLVGNSSTDIDQFLHIMEVVLGE